MNVILGICFVLIAIAGYGPVCELLRVVGAEWRRIDWEDL